MWILSDCGLMTNTTQRLEIFASVIVHVAQDAANLPVENFVTPGTRTRNLAVRMENALS